jgi:hypothetical protein
MRSDRPRDVPSETSSCLSQAERENLQCIVGIMIPADAEYAVPTANDPVIFADIVAPLGNDLEDVRNAIASLAASLAGSVANFLGRHARSKDVTGFIPLANRIAGLDAVPLSAATGRSGSCA